MRRQVHRCRFRFCDTSFFFLLLHPFHYRLWAAYQAGIFSAAMRAEMTDVTQMRKIVPFVTYDFFFVKNLRVDVWYQCIEFEFEHQDLSCPTSNPKQLCGILTHV